MDRRTRRRRTPMLETIEPRLSLSLVTNILALNSQSTLGALRGRVLGSTPVAHADRSGGGFLPSGSSIAIPENQGPQGTNLVLAPQGNPTAHELRRQMFQATFIGPYSIGPGRFDTEALQVFLRGTGRATSMLHSDIQARIVVAKDPTIQNSGATVIFDRNLNSNSALGLDLAGSRQSVDSQGRPNHFDSVTLDVNSSAGVYVEGYSQGIMDIKYIPSGKRSRGVLEQGTAIVKIQAQIYSPNVAFILRNSDINP